MKQFADLILTLFENCLNHKSRKTINLNLKFERKGKQNMSTENVNTNEIVEKELVIAFASYDESEEKITILAAPDGEAPASLNIRLQAYDEDERKYYADEEAKKNGLERLEKTGLTLEDIKAKAFFGKTFNAYVMDGKIYFNKPQRFVKANPIENREAVQLDGLEVVTLPITDQAGKHRFRTMIEAPIKIKGKDEPEMLGFLVSQLIFDDPEDIDTAPYNVGLKYTNKEINDFEEQLKNTEGLPEAVTDSIKAFLEGAVSRAREAKVQELKDLFGFDIDEIIEKGHTLRLKLHKNQIPNSKAFYLSADLLEVIETEAE